MKRRLRSYLLKLLAWLGSEPAGKIIAEQKSLIRRMDSAIADLATRENNLRRSYMERVSELIEARSMMGTGPWTVSPATLLQTDAIIDRAITQFGKPQPAFIGVKESANAITAQGVYGDIELALQNVEWRREVNLSWLEFSRWGIQQIILISRLYYVKNPIVRRLVDVCAAYVFARGVEVSSNNDSANKVLKDFFARNKQTLGQNALTELERRKDYDGNLFFVLFADTQDTGLVNCRTIDATEIQEVWTDPEDTDTPWYYKRVWTQQDRDPMTGTQQNKTAQCWYPALGYQPDDKPPMLAGLPVRWDSPVLHRKCGAVAKWHFGCPRIYPAIDWAKEARKFLEACASVKAALSQIAMQITTKGGQQAMAGIKDQMQTTVGPTSALWDMNPPAVAGSTLVTGPGTTVAAFKQAGVGPNPEEVRQYKLMACMVSGVPETFLGDVSTGNLATATSLDRPTETIFLEKQESWREDLETIAIYVLNVSRGAPSGKLRESSRDVPIRECARKTLKSGRRVYEAFSSSSTAIEVKVDFPAIREGDVPALVKAVNDAMAIDRQGNQHGIDDKTAVLAFCQLLDVENADELVEKLYPEKSYVHDRTLEPEDEGTVPAPTPAAVPGAPKPQPNVKHVPQKEAARIRTAIRRIEAALPVETNGHAQHTH